MPSPPRRLALALAFLLAALSAAAAQEHPVFNTKVEPPQAPVLRDMLQKGGFVIFFRHAATPDYQEPSPVDFSSCERQRNLNGVGRAQAVMIGEAFRELDVAVAEVLASPYCRCMDTARLAFGRVAPDEAVRGDKDKLPTLQRLLSTPPAPGTNRVLVGHGGAAGLLGEEFLREGEAMIVRPDGGDKFTMIARVRAESWAQFLERHRQPPPGTPRAAQ
ncbi:MAG: histidine phosphatase family protein [Alphaproteobacteria bacterium]|nr:histidine phosphatase family protein [Alphaproteobacteria bacterium]MCW5741100.1 histidine phosphatase family protein [Alphaproteobacteria bacterium]